MENRLTSMDNEYIARIIDGVASSENMNSASQLLWSKSLIDIFLVTTKALYLKTNSEDYGTK